jgi:hypothetical protein
MRSTIHLVSARDCLALRPVLQPALDRSLYNGSPWGRGIAGMDIAALVAAARTLLEERPRGLAGASGQAVCTTAEAWLERSLAPRPLSGKMILRYLAAFGPATARDMQAWLGLTGLLRPFHRKPT